MSGHRMLRRAAVYAIGAFLGAATFPSGAIAQDAPAIVTVQAFTPSGEPARDAVVRVVGLGRHEHTDDEGRVSLTLPAGGHVIEVQSLQYGQATRRLNAVPGQELDVRIDLEPAFHAEPIIASVGPEARTRSELYQPTDVLAGRELRELGKNSLGETLSGRPGISSTYYGPGSSRPVIRGLQGDRVRTLQSGIGTGDVSSSGPDHAVATEPLLAGQIEVLRGPSTLLYGSSAIGGAVNSIDPRIPREITGHSLSGFVQFQGASVNDELNGAASLGGTVGAFGWHASGLLRDTDDYAIPDWAELDPLPGEEKPGTLENSALETRTGSLGGSWVGSAGYVGAAVTGYGTRYGVPGHEHHEEGAESGVEAEEPGVVLDLDQFRFDAEGAWNFGAALIRTAKFRAGYADYTHTEFEGDVAGTRFDNTEFEGRLEATHAPLGSVTGTWGVQYGNGDVQARGEEAFLPDTRTQRLAAFLYEEVPVGRLKVGVGARWEGADHETVDGRSRDSGGLSGSLGLNWSASDAVTLTASGSRSVKLPSSEELFSDGPHVATRLYEIGDPDLDNEIGYSGDLALIVEEGPVTGQVAGFVNSFDDFIFLMPTDSVADGLIVARYTQSDALFYGFELSLELSVIHEPDNHLALTGFSDYVWASSRDTDEPLPYIPPLRWGAGVKWEYGRWLTNLDVRRVEEQTRVSEFETPTPGYTMLDATVSYAFFTGGLGHEISLRGTNLANVDARNHVSLLKEIAPLPGRDIRLTYRLMF